MRLSRHRRVFFEVISIASAVIFIFIVVVVVVVVFYNKHTLASTKAGSLIKLAIYSVNRIVIYCMTFLASIESNQSCINVHSRASVQYFVEWDRVGIERKTTLHSRPTCTVLIYLSLKKSLDVPKLRFYHD